MTKFNVWNFQKSLQRKKYYKYQKNDDEIYNLLSKYGSLDKARKYAKRIVNEYKCNKPSLSESCTTVYKFFWRSRWTIKRIRIVKCI